ncbi:MAG: hypothetical protein K6E90_03190 [Lachnospiraceae bacterium]|nr:hypothetical protein [Lachnospiraceae bacterium]
MAGGAQLTQQQRKQQIIGDLNQTAEKTGSLNLTTERLAVDSKQYGQRMSKTSRFISVLGIRRLFHRDQDETPASLNAQAKEQSEVWRDAEKEMSYQKKTSKQEEAAKRRGSFTSNYYTNQKSAAQNALAQYQADLASGTLNIDGSTADGDEFADMMKQDVSVEDKLYDIMRVRDNLKQEIASLQGQKFEAVAFHAEHLKQNLAYTEDALKTMYLANGVSLDGKTVSKRQIANAREHLPLALEKYQYMHKNDTLRFGQGMMKILQKTPEWKTVKESRQQNDQDGRVLGIPRGYGDMYDDLQDLISSHPDEYRAKKKQIDQAFSRFTQCLKKIGEMESDHDIANTLLVGQNAPTAQFARQGVYAIGQRNEKITKLMEYQAESAQALINFLLTGQKTDVLHGEFIEKTWGVKAADQDVNAPLNETLDEYKAVSDAYTNRVRALKAAVASERDPVKLKVLQKALGRLEKVEKAGCAEKADALAYADADAVEGAILKEKAFATPAHKAFTTLPAFKLMADSMSPIEGKPAFTEAELTSYAHKMAIVKTGKDMDGKAADQKAKTEAFRSVLEHTLDQAEEVEKYVQQNPKMFTGRHAYNAMNNWSGMPRFEKKALAVAFSMETFIESPLFMELNEADRKEFVDKYDRIHRMAYSAGDLVYGVSLNEQKTADKYAEDPMNYRILDRADISSQGPKFRDSKAGQYRSPAFQRNYSSAPRAQAG